MVLEPKDLKIESYPPAPVGGMQTGKMANGIRIEHIPTGLVAVCEKHRLQFRNRDDALADLEMQFRLMNTEENSK